MTRPAKQLSFSGADGVQIAAESYGSAQNRPVLFLHGGGQTRRSWRSSAQKVAAQGYYSISLDLRGHGDSGWAQPDRYRLDDFVDDVRSIVHTLRDPPVMVGASLGGIISLLIAGEIAPEKVRAVALVDVTPNIDPEGVKLITSFMRAKPEGFVSLDEAANAVVGYLPHRKRPPDAEGLRNNLRLHENGRYYWHWDPNFILDKNQQDFVPQARLMAAAGNMLCPCLLIRGAKSEVVSKEGADSFVNAIPNIRLIDVPDAHHMVAGDNNSAFMAEILEFLSST
jgi:pimeloyl-ACP methyl ester carboxylesterase